MFGTGNGTLVLSVRVTARGLGDDGVFTFTIADLLANDPGGAAKVDVTKQFFFGSTAADQANQAGYLTAHGITNNGDGTFTIQAGATDFSYFVQIGNKGTWSQADVDVTAPVPQLGDRLFTEDFDHTPISTFNSNGAWASATIDLEAEGWAGTGHDDQFHFTTVSEVGVSGVLGGIKATSGNFWLDTQYTPGGIDISHTFTDTTAEVGGKTAVLSFDIAKMAVKWDLNELHDRPERFLRLQDRRSRREAVRRSRHRELDC